MRIILYLLAIVFCFNSSILPQEFSSKQEAQKEFDKMYGKDDSDDQYFVKDLKENEFNSIRCFLKNITEDKQRKIYIVYGSKSHIEGAQVIKSFLDRKRGYTHLGSNSNKTGVIIISDNKFKNLKKPKGSTAILLGSGSNNLFIRSLLSRKAVSISGNKAQFKLVRAPHSLVIACVKNDMFVELARVIMRSYMDFFEDSYSYFYIN